jgi:hypothetical protein
LEAAARRTDVLKPPVRDIRESAAALAVDDDIGQ